ncbi:MAG TPA: hypothetical protein VH540_25785 [Ktedonobacterales bacterium]|jgi:hypothetical protein
MNYQQEQSQHGISYDMSSPNMAGFGYDPQPGQMPGQPGAAWVAVQTPPPVQQHIYMPKPQHRVAVAIISLLVLVPISLGLLLSVNDDGPFTNYTSLVARLIALGIVCGTIAGINASFHNTKH